MADKNRNTIWEYLQWRGDLSIEQDGFNEVDNLILCIISYIDFRRLTCLRTTATDQAVTLSELCHLVTEEDGQRTLSIEDYIPFLRAVAVTRRFGDVKMFAFEDSYDEETVMQFSAVTFLLPDESVFVAYRGTDTTLVGWVEDFNMSFLATVPAQERALQYALEVAKRTPRRPLRLGGHSKGGNLAAYAAIHLPARLQNKRLVAAYNNDGPGFDKSVLASEGFVRVREKIHTYIPESSIVGMLLEHTEDYTVIDSSNRSLLQHEPLSWKVRGPRFIALKEQSEAAQLSDTVIRDWLADLSMAERQEFVESVYSILSVGGKNKTLDDLRNGGLSGGVALLKEYIGADEKKKEIISELLRRLGVEWSSELRRAAEEKLRTAEQNARQALQNLRKDKTEK